MKREERCKNVKIQSRTSKSPIEDQKFLNGMENGDLGLKIESESEKG